MFETFLQQNDLASLLLPKAERRAFPPCADRAAWEALPPAKRRAVLRWGDEAVAEGYPMLTATQFMAFVRTGDRQVFEKPYFLRRSRLMGAALAECVQNDGAYLDAVVDGLWCILEESAWTISAHNVDDHPGRRPAQERPLPDVQAPVVDLFAAQTAATVARVMDLLGDKLDGVTPLIRRRALRELSRRVFTPFLTRDDFWWMGVVRQDLNNWTPWIVSNVMAAMLCTVDDRTLLAEGLARGMRMLDRYLRVMPADGGLDEGCGYWNMAGGSLLDCLESLYTATGGRADFYADPLIRRIGAFPAHAHIAGGWYLNFADCDARPLMDGERMYRYGLRTHNERLVALGAQAFAARGDDVRPQDTPQMDRVLFGLFQPPPPLEAEPPAEAKVDLPDLQVYARRSGRLYAGIKGGHNGENHNHNDVGSFVCFIDGEPQVVDAGNMVYTAKTFGAERYTLWNTRARNHNIPLVGGVEQQAGKAYRATDVRVQDAGVTLSLKEAYPPEAGVERFERTLWVQEEQLTLTDELCLTDAKPVTWVFLLRDRPERCADGLRFGKARLCMDAGMEVQVEEIPVEDARMARSFPGSLWRATLTAAPARTHRHVFCIMPE